MEFRKALPADFTNIINLYKSATMHLDHMGIHQWDDVYPSANLLKEDIENEELYIGLIDSNLACAFVLNPHCDEEYVFGNWQYPTLAYLVLHRFCVNPPYQNKCIGTQTMVYIEEILKSKNFQSLRLDAFSKNPSALRLYEKFSFKKVGEVNFTKGVFYLFEKKL